MAEPLVETLCLDIGGILLNNGWDEGARERSAERFGIERDEMESRHRAAFCAYELGTLTLRQYLQLTVFWKPREFSFEDLESFMFEQSQPHKEAIRFFAGLKERNQLRVVAISNEGRELADYRNRTFGLGSFMDAFVMSGYVGIRKPDPRMYQMALDVAGAKTETALIIDDRPVLVEMASILGMRTLHYSDLASAQRDLSELGLR